MSFYLSPVLHPYVRMKERTAEIHSELKQLVQKQRLVLGKVLDQLSELNRRKGFLEFGHPSLLKYCVKELGLSESAAYRRIKALRIVEKSPSVKQKLQDGKLNLAQVARAQEIFQEHKHETGAKIPEFKKAQMLGTVERKDLHESENGLRELLQLPPKKRRITIEVGEETYQAWNEFKGSMIHKNMSDEMLLRFAIEQAACVKKPSRIHKPRKHDPKSRYIPAHLKREVFEKAQYKCSWPSCSSVYGLEVDHIKPVSEGGQTSRDNLRLLCRHHNQARNFH